MKKDHLILTASVIGVLALSCGTQLWNVTMADQSESVRLPSPLTAAISDTETENQLPEDINSENLNPEDADDSKSSSSDHPHTESPTLTSLLKNAVLPKDQVLYVWGGGWNEEDTAGNEETNHLGLSESWLDFFNANYPGYDYAEHLYEIHSGLDCSGYVGWVLYNTLQDGMDHVVLAERYDEVLSEQGLGTRKDASEVTDILPGDIMTAGSHIYIALGQYEDGSILLIHSSPPGVRISGTAGIAYEVAQEYQTNGWDPLVDSSYLYYDQFRFSDSVLSDPDQILSMSPDQALDFILNTDS